jgi:urease accessory protein
VCALCLVGSAAGPLPGDDLTLRLEVAPYAHASLVAAGATIAQGHWNRGDEPARLHIIASVGERASLSADPGELIVCAGSRVEVRVSITLADSARLRWREVVVLGRSAEAPGAATLDWDVHRAGRSLLRQHLDLTDAAHNEWPGQVGQHRRIESELCVDPLAPARTIVHGPAHVTQKLAEHAALTTRLGR